MTTSQAPIPDVTTPPAEVKVEAPKRRSRGGMHHETWYDRLGLHLVMLILVAWSIIPFTWAFQNSIKFVRDIIGEEPKLWGYEPTAIAYNGFWFDDEDINMWYPLLFILAFATVAVILGQLGKRARQGAPWYLATVAVLAFGVWWFPNLFDTSRSYDYFVNSLIVTVLTVVISITIGCFAGYGLARYTGVSGAVILIVALGFRALPRSAFVLPYFFAANRLGILDSRLVLVLALVAVNQPFTIWMLRSFFMDVPKSLEEAAIMDGATRFGAFRRVIVPIMWPGIIATALFTLLLAYNEFLFVRVLAVTNFTLPVGIEAALAAEGPQLFNEIPAASVSITLPIIIVIILFQKHLVKGLGAGAVKG